MAAFTAVTGYAQLALSAASSPLDALTGLLQYRPPLWSTPNYVPLVMVTVPGGSGVANQSTSVSDITGSADSAFTLAVSTTGRVVTTAPSTYVWDGYPRVEHELQSVPTRIPTQVGSVGTDHIILQPARLIVEIVCSDVLQSYKAGQFDQGILLASDPIASLTTSKSVGAYKVLKQLWRDRKLVTVTTRLDTYINMAITGIRAPDDYDTQYGLRALVVFEEILQASISSSYASDRPDALDISTLGDPGISSPDANLIQEHQLESLPLDAYMPVPGAGDIDSNPLGS